MLELHGGPGASHAAYGPRTRAWEEHFTVVRWDMRGTGKTLGRSDAAAQGEISLDRLYEDALEATRYVLARLGAERVVLAAHSFGSVIGLRLGPPAPRPVCGLRRHRPEHPRRRPRRQCPHRTPGLLAHVLPSLARTGAAG
ncbi:alpha/beta fold hydrolase [Streptomyces sp. NPDC046866]|uniref:alpha/beta fold hydrolase n=1 Tax=Streptomyces sp. NPDC046866 TaxID=3154921 RepID=UPI0034562114